MLGTLLLVLLSAASWAEPVQKLVSVAPNGCVRELSDSSTRRIEIPVAVGKRPFLTRAEFLAMRETYRDLRALSTRPDGTMGWRFNDYHEHSQNLKNMVYRLGIDDHYFQYLLFTDDGPGHFPERLQRILLTNAIAMITEAFPESEDYFRRKERMAKIWLLANWLPPNSINTEGLTWHQDGGTYEFNFAYQVTIPIRLPSDLEGGQLRFKRGRHSAEKWGHTNPTQLIVEQRTNRAIAWKGRGHLVHQLEPLSVGPRSPGINAVPRDIITIGFSDLP